MAIAGNKRFVGQKNTTSKASGLHKYRKFVPDFEVGIQICISIFKPPNNPIINIIET